MSRDTIERFYAAFAKLDADAMQACYAENAQFEDEVFKLGGRREVGGMWRMLCETTRAKGQAHWKLECSDIRADTGKDGREGSAHWEAHYLFSATGRLVHNRIDASFEFDEAGLILRHRDRFDFPTWARQALGPTGLLLGWTPWLRSQVRAKAATQLARFLATPR